MPVVRLQGALHAVIVCMMFTFGRASRLTNVRRLPRLTSAGRPRLPVRAQVALAVDEAGDDDRAAVAAHGAREQVARVGQAGEAAAAVVVVLGQVAVGDLARDVHVGR